MREGYEVAQDPSAWDMEQQEVRDSREADIQEEDELAGADEDDEETSGGKRKKATKEKSKAKKPKTAKKVSFCFWLGVVERIRVNLDSRLGDGQIAKGRRESVRSSTGLESRGKIVDLGRELER